MEEVKEVKELKGEEGMGGKVVKEKEENVKGVVDVNEKEDGMLRNVKEVVKGLKRIGLKGEDEVQNVNEKVNDDVKIEVVEVKVKGNEKKNVDGLVNEKVKRKKDCLVDYLMFNGGLGYKLSSLID
ncbi:hypothetical protein, partial [Staphylococcus auricularis]|uniref:hypothetical protein n=1 Tax=Staphylococcus auricularis TaxID=29379 RepID=UPI001248DB46